MALSGLCARSRGSLGSPRKRRHRLPGVVALALGVSLMAAPAVTKPLFPNPARLFDVGPGSFLVEPIGLVSADLNDDGHPDLIAGLNAGGALVVLLGNGDGTFAPAVEYPSDHGPF